MHKSVNHSNLLLLRSKEEGLGEEPGFIVHGSLRKGTVEGEPDGK